MHLVRFQLIYFYFQSISSDFQLRDSFRSRLMSFQLISCRYQLISFDFQLISFRFQLVRFHCQFISFGFQVMSCHFHMIFLNIELSSMRFHLGVPCLDRVVHGGENLSQLGGGRWGALCPGRVVERDDHVLAA